jgi:hypothetical protein
MADPTNVLGAVHMFTTKSIAVTSHTRGSGMVFLRFK